MLVSLNWLKQYVNIDSETPEELAEKITRAGIEVDGIEYVTTEKSEHVVVGYVKECEQHPNADKLKLCQVDVGDEVLQIICGAPNVAQGQKVVVAKPGAVLPGNFKIKKVKLRGVESNGMICSLQELGVGERFIPAQFADGIVVLQEDAVVGEDVTELLNLDDVILEFDLTPNRADALSMIGVAYEVAAILDKDISLPEPKITPSGENAKNYISVHSEDADLCPYYGAFIVKDVEIKQAPIWMQNYLLAAGVRPINNVVDITNYVLLEYGQPLHAFDYDVLGSKEIVVRRATNGETIITLDDQERTLTDENLLITNGKEGIALAGVMGGANTEVTDETKNVLIEAAYFDPQTVRKAVNETGLRSDASTRFEKGVAPERVKEAGLRACELLVTYANGTVVGEAVEFDQLTIEEKVLTVQASKVNKRLGTDISVTEMEDILRKLRFKAESNGDHITIRVPTRRGDVTIFEDVVEEIARIYGYDHLPYTLPHNASQPGGLTREQFIVRRMKNFLQSAGLAEAITYSLVNKKQATSLISPDMDGTLQPVKLAMPMSEDHQYLRLSLLPELLNRLSYNVARKQTSVALYEVGSVFLNKSEVITKQPEERRRVAGAITGTWVDHPWQQEVKQVDFYVIKGIVESLIRYIQLEPTFTKVQVDGMHPGRCATVEVNGEVIGFIGQIHPAYAKDLDLKDTYVFDLNAQFLIERAAKDHSYDPVSRHPANIRDIAFVVKEDVLAGDIRDEMKRLGKPLVQYVEVFDVYKGEPLQEEEKSLAFNVSFQAQDKTLTDEEVDEAFAKIVEHIKEKFAAYVRE